MPILPSSTVARFIDMESGEGGPQRSSEDSMGRSLIKIGDQAVSMALAAIACPALDTTVSIAVKEAEGIRTIIEASKSEAIRTSIEFPMVESRPIHGIPMEPEQEWEGYVIERGSDDFVVRLIDITGGDESESQEAVLPLADLSEHDLARVDVGSRFYWVIGYKTLPSGTKERVSKVVFRDLPAVTDRDRSAGRKWADETIELLGL